MPGPPPDRFIFEADVYMRKFKGIIQGSIQTNKNKQTRTVLVITLVITFPYPLRYAVGSGHGFLRSKKSEDSQPS